MKQKSIRVRTVDLKDEKGKNNRGGLNPEV